MEARGSSSQYLSAVSGNAHRSARNARTALPALHSLSQPQRAGPSSTPVDADPQHREPAIQTVTPHWPTHGDALKKGDRGHSINQENINRIDTVMLPINRSPTRQCGGGSSRSGRKPDGGAATRCRDVLFVFVSSGSRGVMIPRGRPCVRCSIGTIDRLPIAGLTLRARAGVWADSRARRDPVTKASSILV